LATRSVGVNGVTQAIFLSASVPDPKRAPNYAATADTVAIGAAVTALVYVTLGRRMLIWGGHPAITPMIWTVAESVGVEYGGWVKLYQSLWFQDDFPEDNQKFKNVTFTDAGKDLANSLLHMRQRMFTEHQFDAAVFIGGMGGIVDEFNLFRKLQPKANAIPILSTGGAVLDLEVNVTAKKEDLKSNMDYVTLFHHYLNIAPQEVRYPVPAEQPTNPADRLWKPPPTQKHSREH